MAERSGLMGRRRGVPEDACVACLEPIKPGARRCPHCHAPQQPEKAKLLGSVLKWTGGITAVISLVIGSASVYQLYTGWEERRTAVAELLAASHIQLGSQDYDGGWMLLKQALELEPASEAVRRFQIPYAMEWLRNIRVSGDRTFADIVDRLLPVLYRGAADARRSVAADVYAHIGWANYLKWRSGQRGIEIDRFYRKALELDPGNAYANVHWGHWTLSPMNGGKYKEPSIEKALHHFDTALKSGRDRDYVVNLTLGALLDSNDPAAPREVLAYALRFRKSGIPIPARRLEKILYSFEPIASFDPDYGERALKELTALLPLKDLRAFYDWAVAQKPTRLGTTRLKRQYIAARLAEAAGDRAASLSGYRALSKELPADSTFMGVLVRPALKRIGVADQGGP